MKGYPCYLISVHKILQFRFTDDNSRSPFTVNVQFSNQGFLSSVFTIHTLFFGQFADHAKPLPDTAGKALYYDEDTEDKIEQGCVN